MVVHANVGQRPTHALSVLALSSRFDGPACYTGTASCPTLSVLALSSRFDGRAYPSQM